MTASRYAFFNGPWENATEPTLVMDNPTGGDPIILARLIAHRPEDLANLCALANLQALSHQGEGGAEAVELREVLTDLVSIENRNFNPGSYGAAVIGSAREVLAKTFPIAPPQGGEWRAIKSAPKDGTPILVFNSMVGVYSTAFTVRWDGSSAEWAAFKDGKPAYSGFPCGFWSSGLGSFPFGQWDCQPTHWQPLPTPPKEHDL